MTDRARWAIVTAVLLVLLAIVIWLVAADAAIVRFTVRLYQDKKFLKETVRSWGWKAPLVCIAIQALQVIISPIPGELSRPAGRALFGTWLGRLPGTWISSYFGAHVAEQQYIYAIAFLAIVVALCLPVYYYRGRIIKRFHKPRTGQEERPESS